VSDGPQLQVRPQDSGSSLILSSANSRLIARGRKDAAMLVTRSASVTIGATAVSTTEVICEMCGEHEELDSASDGFCRWCRSRESEIAEVWGRWGFDRWGRPLDGGWDDKAAWRDAQAKLEIDEHLKHLGLKVRWIEMWSGFGNVGQRPVRRGQIQAFAVAETVSQEWGFDSDGNVGGSATIALEELKRILAALGLPLPDDWPDEWTPNKAYALNPLDIAVGVWPGGVRPGPAPTCHKCGEQKQMVFAGTHCASCADAID
jgi:hypothetical protein